MRTEKRCLRLFGTLKLLAAVGAFSFGLNATAASINYGDFSGTNTMYLDVTESSGTDTAPLFGPPDISGDVLDFDPTTFTASATSGNADITDGQLNFDIMSAQGTGLTSLLFTESGDYTLLGNGTDATLVFAGLAVQIKITEVDGNTLGTPINIGYTTSLTRDLVNGPTGLQLWSQSLLVDFDAVLTSNNINYSLGVTKAEVVLDDQLVAISQNGTVAFIAKKDFAITGNGVPEPGSLALMGLASILIVRRRRA